MAYNFNNAAAQYPNQQFNQPMPQQQNQQNVQPLFPQPQGNVYNINSTLEVANVPVGAGLSIALCLNEGVMYIKTMQNGNPLFWAYKITPYENSTDNKKSEETQTNFSEDFLNQFKQLSDKVENIENQVSDMQKNLKKKKGDWEI